ncbi:hypothetical protein GPECTOR_50g575 [Gonium pectorale]|uniref:Uncharacterized protein n=1 Tax=Gonium pectorale TaxID=33097 RepID=A0A150G7F8_GONPE|nr:hypothetical protein GPECTOR_50g575 [Gonium pectorale]|eukprot:KXZ45782.1 hypothetical protein GPECTOR_50g575 [Gonium pectorale]
MARSVESVNNDMGNLRSIKWDVDTIKGDVKCARRNLSDIESELSSLSRSVARVEAALAGYRAEVQKEREERNALLREVLLTGRYDRAGEP